MERDTRLKQYKLDIIVPVYNGERYIGPFFDMLEKQANSLQDLRVIFVDDGSTDSTSSLIKERANNSKVPIKLISQGNCGVRLHEIMDCIILLRNIYLFLMLMTFFLKII